MQVTAHVNYEVCLVTSYLGWILLLSLMFPLLVDAVVLVLPLTTDMLFKA